MQPGLQRLRGGIVLVGGAGVTLIIDVFLILLVVFSQYSARLALNRVDLRTIGHERWKCFASRHLSQTGLGFRDTRTCSRNHTRFEQHYVSHTKISPTKLPVTAMAPPCSKEVEAMAELGLCN